KTVLIIFENLIMNYKLISVLLLPMLIVGCAATPTNTTPAASTGGNTTDSSGLMNTGIGAITGAAAGAAIGAAIGGKNKAKSAVIGAAAGAVLGSGLGYYFDQQQQQLTAEFQKMPELQTTPVVVKKDNQDLAIITPGNIAFASGSSVLQTSVYPVLDKIIAVLKQSLTTRVTISGHTDSVGKPDLNLQLSKSRAESIAKYFIQQGITSSRIQAFGYGDTQPIASNDNDQGRAQNRRVEIKIHAPQ
ncbi:MAG: hypothetical protein RL637_1737, partial [Pseudomonadota bacterium]